MKKFSLGAIVIALIFTLSSCFTSTDEGTSDYRLTCKIDGVSKTFYAGGFGLETYNSTYNNFYESPDNENEYVYLKFPHPVVTNYAYSKADTDFELAYQVSSTENYTSSDSTATLTLTVTEWGTNNGDPIRGTFSGKISSLSGEKIITDGTFESELVQ